MKRVGQWMAARPRMLLALSAGVSAVAMSPAGTMALTRVLLGWNVATWCYLLLLWWLMARASSEHIRQVARRQDESAARTLLLVCLASLMSLLAIVLELARTRGLPPADRFGHALLASVTLLGAWLLLPTLFAVHYAHLFYGSSAEARPLLFPDRPAAPDYWDFAYFSFTIAVAAQTADVAPNNGMTRRLVLLQSVLAFIFNASILAMSINVAAGLLG